MNDKNSQPDFNPVSKEWWNYALRHPLYLILSLLGLSLGAIFIFSLLFG